MSLFSLSHLAVSNSTPPPATSPVSIKVKAEPQSPPRDLSASGHQQNSNGSTGSGGSSSTTSSNTSGNGGGGGGGLAAASTANVITHLNNVSVLAGGGPSGGGSGSGGGGGGASNGSVEQATNLSVLSHSQQQHLGMPSSRPSSTGHITPTTGGLRPLLPASLCSFLLYVVVFLELFSEGFLLEIAAVSILICERFRIVL